MALGAIHWGTLAQVVWVSLLAGIGITAVFSLVILTSARATEHGHSGRRGAALGFALLAATAFAVFGVGIALGVSAMFAK
jgi:hypothetical protein